MKLHELKNKSQIELIMYIREIQVENRSLMDRIKKLDRYWRNYYRHKKCN